jgi:diguanylate cyclase (GGDEF)-like protein/PAS domain S-box-containing protein
LKESSFATRRNRLLLDLLVLAALTGLTAWVSLAIARTPHGVAAAWISNGIWAGWLLSRRTSLWPGYVAVGMASLLAARYLAGDGLPSTLALSAFNLLEVLIVAGVIRRSVPDVGNPRHWLGLGSIATASTLVACAVSALLASAWLKVHADAGFLANFLTWYAAHVVGMVVVGTLALVVHRKGIGLVDVPGQRLDFLGCMLLIAVVGGAVFYQSSYPLLFLLFPPLLFGVFRHRFPGLVVGISLLAVIGIVATGVGHGPLALVHGNDIERVILFQLFVGAACLMGFPVALGMAERARLMARVRDSELRYRMLADHSHDVVVRMRADGQRLYVSPSARDILGWEPAELLSSGNLVHGEDRAVQQQMIDAVLASGQAATATYRLRHKDGHYVWMESVARPIPGTGNEAADIILAGRDVSGRVAAEQALLESRNELEAQARVDPLTGLANRRQFDERLALALTRSRRHGQALALMYMDVDHFKQVNDGYGHAAGDEVLRVFGQRLVACVRAGDLVARVGGDEFVILVEDLEARETAETIARKLVAAMGKAIVVEGGRLPVTASIGIAYSAQPTEARALAAVADAALYAAKHAGRNGWQLLVADDPLGPDPQLPA